MGHFHRVLSAALRAMNAAPALREPGLWRRAALWLAVLGPFFFASYGFATWLSSQRSDVGSVVYAWESVIPFWPWTIIPYWSIDLLYALALFICTQRRELDNLGRQLLTAQLIAVSCFLLWPLQFTLPRPETSGVFGALFEILGAFDKPFNQAPSLHIALLVILWVCYQRHVQGFGRWLLHIWMGLIGLSVLTTWQHHFIDLPTGALLGWLCIWLWPHTHLSPLRLWHLSHLARRQQLALAYALGSLGLTGLGFTLGGAGLWLCWPAVSCLLVSLNYLAVGPAGFQKNAHGRLSTASRWLFGPYTLAAWINSRLWTRQQPDPSPVDDNLWLGRLPCANALKQSPFVAVVDLCAELPLDPQGRHYQSLAQLDLSIPSLEDCWRSARAIEHALAYGPTLVCCALGYSRSAVAVVAWLLYSRRADSLEAALGLLREKRPQVVIGVERRAVLQQFAQACQEHAYVR